MAEAPDKDTWYAERIREDCGPGDVEIAHHLADKLIVQLLRELGYTKTAEAWEAVDKWYA